VQDTVLGKLLSVTGTSERPKAHHVLPQFYLRAWSDERGLIAMLNRDGKEVKTGSKALAVENDFYTVTNPQGEKDGIVEKALAEIDAQGAAAHSALLRCEFPLEPEQKIAFAEWLGLQWVRGRSSRASGRELADKMQKMLNKFGLQNADIKESSEGEPDSDSEDLDEDIPLGAGPAIEVPDLSHIPKDEREKLEIELDNYEFVIPKEFQLLQMLKMRSPAALPFLEAEWHLLQFEDKLLFTSDEPIILQRNWRPENKFLGIGPASADHIYVPLSPNLCLAMIRAGSIGKQTFRNLPKEEAEKVRGGTLKTWWSQLFRHVDGPSFPDSIPSLPSERVEVG
jgi:hypothetical protein